MLSLASPPPAAYAAMIPGAIATPVIADDRPVAWLPAAPAPSAVDELFYSGFRVGADGQLDAAPPAELDGRGRAAWAAGHGDGVREFHAAWDARVMAEAAERAEELARPDDAGRHHDCEIVEARGIAAAIPAAELAAAL